jgi:uncharacterized membrane protein YkoI
MQCQDLPAAVRSAAAKQKGKPSTERSCEKISDEGKTLYEVKITTTAGKMREIVFRPDGTIAELEDEGDLESIPAAARAAIQKAASSGQLYKVDLIRRGSDVLYEGEYREGGTKKKIIVDATGRMISK